MSDEIQIIPPRFPNLRLERMLGQGGMARVWAGYDLSMDRRVAVKVLDAELTKSAADVSQFLEEARMMTNIHHPGIVHAYDMRCSHGVYYFVMELVDGYTFADRIKSKGKVSEEEAIIIAESVSVALDYAWDHFKVVHCDIKPENLMVNQDGVVKVADLGLCHRNMMKKDLSEEESDEVIGTPGYISPEQVYGDPVLDSRVDIYSLGATLYHLVTGHLLFEGLDSDAMLRAHVQMNQAVDPRTFAPELSYPFVQLIERMLAKDKASRFRNWKEVIEALKLVVAGKRLPKLDIDLVSSVAVKHPTEAPKPIVPSATSAHKKPAIVIKPPQFKTIITAERTRTIVPPKKCGKIIIRKGG